jgi:hypothetical protein
MGTLPEGTSSDPKYSDKSDQGLEEGLEEGRIATESRH